MTSFLVCFRVLCRPRVKQIGIKGIELLWKESEVKSAKSRTLLEGRKKLRKKMTPCRLVPGCPFFFTLL